MKFTELETGAIGLIQQQENGDIVQIGLRPDQSKMLQAFLAAMSKDEKLVLLPEQFNLKIIGN